LKFNFENLSVPPLHCTKWTHMNNLSTHLKEMELLLPNYCNASMMNTMHQYRGKVVRIAFQIHSWNQLQLPMHSFGFFHACATLNNEFREGRGWKIIIKWSTWKMDAVMYDVEDLLTLHDDFWTIPGWK
jgi:hypothetical protein